MDGFWVRCGVCGDVCLTDSERNRVRLNAGLACSVPGLKSEEMQGKSTRMVRVEYLNDSNSNSSSDSSLHNASYETKGPQVSSASNVGINDQREFLP